MRARRANNQGISLLEVTMSLGIFTGAVVIVAQSLASVYMLQDLQRQRTIAIQQCRAVLSDMRSIRDANPNSATSPTNFQTKVLAAYPNNTTKTGPANLKNASVKVVYENSTPTSNPLVATVTVQWQDLVKRTMSANVSSALTDR